MWKGEVQMEVQVQVEVQMEVEVGECGRVEWRDLR